MQAVEVRRVSYAVRSALGAPMRPLLCDVSLSVPEGTAVALVGKNGAGKTTLIKAMLGSLRPQHGEVLVFGRPADCPEARVGVGLMPERPGFSGVLRAREVMWQQARLAGLSRAEAEAAVTRNLDRVQLGDAGHSMVRAFSKGMLQRLALAQALLGQPRLLLLDEPMSGLDPEGRLLMRDVLLQARARGVTLVFSSHAPADVELLANHVAVLEGGRIVRQGSPETVLEPDTGSIEILAGGSLSPARLQQRLPACCITSADRHVICAAVNQADADAAIDIIRQSGGHVLGVVRRPGGVQNGATHA